VIDAEGGAAYFELSNQDYVKYDANDPNQAPNGYLIRTNYSVSGKYGDGGGYIRYVTINDVFGKAVREGNLSAKLILQEGSRNLTHSLTKTDLTRYEELPENNPAYVFFKDYIPRSGTSASCVVEGVCENDNPELTTMWSLVGFPLSSVTVPLWLHRKASLPKMVSYDDSLKNAPVSYFSLQLKSKIYDYKLGSHSQYYININQVLNADKSGIMQKCLVMEDLIFSRSIDIQQQFNKKGSVDVKILKKFYSWLDEVLMTFYNNEFNLNMTE
jgi:hypothetical protein